MNIDVDEVLKLDRAASPDLATRPIPRSNLHGQPVPASALLAASPPVVELRRVTRQFGTKTALDDVSLSIPRGGVFGLIGGNGAGKTTVIKHILGLLKAQTGSVSVFGLDPVQNPVGTLGRIGYLSEDRDLPDWMSRWRTHAVHASFLP